MSNNVAILHISNKNYQKSPYEFCKTSVYTYVVEFLVLIQIQL